jgi:hypothetical protein
VHETEFGKDFFQDKAQSDATWWIAAVNQHFSRIRRQDLDILPGSTNLNESAHPAVNRHTDINLPLLVAING